MLLRRRGDRLVLVAAAIAIMAAILLATGCGGGGSNDSDAPTRTYYDPTALDPDSLPYAGFEYTFHEPPDGCQAGYDTITLNGVERDVTYCYSGPMSGGHPQNTGCWTTDTGEDVTVALRNLRGSTELC